MARRVEIMEIIKFRPRKTGKPEERTVKSASATHQSAAVAIIRFPGRKSTMPTPSGAPPENRKRGRTRRPLPIVKPPYDDYALLHIARHREAVLAYDRAVDAQVAAEGMVSPEEYDYLQAVRQEAFSDMMLMARCLVIARPQTRRGAIHLTRYLASQFNDVDGCDNGCMYMPDDINGEPWPKVFLRSLADGLRRMGAEFPKIKRKRGRLSGAQKLELHEAFARIPPHLIPTAIQYIDKLNGDSL
jgi:hypothetical protein